MTEISKGLTNMKKRIGACFCVVVLSVIFACDNDREIVQETSIYSWTVTHYTPDNIIFYDLKLGPDGRLYGAGLGYIQQVFAMLTTSGWQILAEVEEPYIRDFTFYHDTIYYTADNQLKKAKGTFVESILTGPVAGVEVFQDKLIITGALPFEYKGKEYTVMSYEMGGKFTPIDSGIQSSRMININGKLFIEGHPLKIYDGATLMSHEYAGGFLNIDTHETIYSWKQFDGYFFIDKFADDKYVDVGTAIYSSAIVNRLEFNHSTIVVSGINDQSISESFYLNSKNHWVEIPTTHQIYDLINFNHKIVATTSEGDLLELTLN